MIILFKNMCVISGMTMKETFPNLVHIIGHKSVIKINEFLPKNSKFKVQYLTDFTSNFTLKLNKIGRSGRAYGKLP